MARFSERLAENVDGDFFVDRSCIDCDLCRQLAPETFVRSGRQDQSFVRVQPRGEAEQRRALIALVTCPSRSIGTTRKLDARAAARALPERVEGSDEVYFCGWASEASYGAAAWLVRRPDGNVLVDSPRFTATLAERIAELGGVRWMFLSHRDDVADHRAFAKRFGCERVIHRGDVDRGTHDCERIVDGDAPIAFAPDLAIVPVPGHTRGSCALIYRDRFAFTGDHVWGNDDGTALEAGRNVCWYSWPAQRAAMARLAEHRFTHVLPGHGRRFRAPSPTVMQAAVRALAASM
jgi:glyoxylase-like metal-dependent hydrolase (beta-lactamase superfamily II)/ferredoxin